ncbi:DUF1120 domain-containing protein [Pseudomonas carnis]|uniref:DUF1120 domain-containing protein n=1 Tax=Pseudomonas carnis TaxID=2487355 RepID=UPI0018D62A8D|nr:DUF1120 domain-containing protein [Pseudomonas carnis]MBH3367984.1 DUF1120 domain-containing protein [Pseudomonas carnis]
MKTCLSLLNGALLLVMTSSVFAASSVDLTVKGLITPSACTPSLSQGGVADYGKIAAKDLRQNESTPLPITNLQFGVTCEAATRFALNAVDNRPGSGTEASHSFGLGLINETEKLGNFVIILTHYVADNLSVTKLASRDNGATWDANSEDAIWMRGRLAAFGDDSSGNWAPSAITKLSSDLIIQPYIAPSGELTLTQEQPIDGSATVELLYL